MRKTTIRIPGTDSRFPDSRFDKVPGLRRALRRRRAANKVARLSRKGNR